jgi:putative endonuclease
MSFKSQIGQFGEDKAAEFLAQQGFKILERNYRQKWGEIDIVALKDKTVRFIEVKTVTRHPATATKDDYEPEDNIHPWKRKRLRRAIETYLLAKEEEMGDDDWQVDVIAVYLDATSRAAWKIDWLQDEVI